MWTPVKFAICLYLLRYLTILFDFDLFDLFTWSFIWFWNSESLGRPTMQTRLQGLVTTGIGRKWAVLCINNKETNCILNKFD